MVTAGSALSRRPRSRSSRRARWASAAASARVAEGATYATPSPPSTTIGSPGVAASRPGPSPTTIGSPSPRATTAACAVGAPPASASPTTSGPSSATSAGPSSGATRTTSSAAATAASGGGRRAPFAASGGEPDGAAAERAHVLGTRGEGGVVERGDRRGVAGGARLERCRGGHAAEHRALDVVDEHGVLRHQHACADDFRLVAADALGQRLELLRRGVERLMRALDLERAALLGHGLVRHRAAAEDAGASERPSRRCRVTAEGVLGHQLAGTRARPSARTISAVDVAPGSW